MQRKTVAWILNFTDQLPNDEERIKCLQANGTHALKSIVKYGLDPDIEWLLPEGDPEFEINNEDGNEAKVYSEARKMHHFIKGGNDGLHPIKRERIFISFLESINEEDSRLVLHAKNKKLPYKNITLKLVKKAFPELFPNG